MDQLEQLLRDVLTDDRLEIPLRPGALRVLQDGVRRRRRSQRTALAAVAVATVGVVAGAALTASGLTHRARVAIGADHERPSVAVTQPAVTPTSSTSGRIDIYRAAWSPAGYDPARPPAFPGTVPDTSIAWCKAAALDLGSVDSWDGSAGDVAGALVVTNSSTSTCALQGQPALTLHDGGGAVVATATPDLFFVNPWLQLAPGQQAETRVTWDHPFCSARSPQLLQLTLPNDGGELTTSPPDVTPECTSADVTTPNGALSASGFLRFASQHVVDSFTPEADLRATVSRVTPRVLAGNAVRYRVRLDSSSGGQIQLDPCLPYRERLVDVTTHAVVAEELHVLNCSGPNRGPDRPDSGYINYYAMQLTVPSAAAPGTYTVQWQSVLQPVADIDGGTVTVMPVPPLCRQDQLQIQAGRTGAAGGSFYDAIVFRNVSAAPCSLRGYPGIEFAGPARERLTTRALRSSLTLPQTVVLQPHGGTASATVSGADFGPDGGATPCTDTAGLRVIAPDLSQQVLVPGVGMDCQHHRITVGPVVSGSRIHP